MSGNRYNGNLMRRVNLKESRLEKHQCVILSGRLFESLSCKFGAQLEETAEEREALSKLPSTQPPDPSEADHTVVIKDLSASPPKSVVSPSTGKSKEDDEYEAMQKRFAALTALKKK